MMMIMIIIILIITKIIIIIIIIIIVMVKLTLPYSARYDRFIFFVEESQGYQLSYAGP